MDAIDVILGIFVLVLIAVLAGLIHGLILAIIKENASTRTGFTWIYRGKLYKLKEPDWTKSKYLNKYHDREDKYLGCFATVDDEVI